MLDFADYNPSEEPRSCVARTMTKLTGLPYDTVKQELAALASDMGYPEWNETAVFEAYLAKHGLNKIMGDSGIQVQALPDMDGICCIFCTNRDGFYHLMPVVDGVIYDRRDAYRGMFVLAVYQKKETEE